jgi:RNA polymerase sigma-70 factor (ECF subfamily)
MCIEDMIRQYATYIYNYAMKLACHPQKAEDIAQETFISAWKNIEQLRDEQAIKKWLRTICLNHFLMDYRKNNQEKTELHEDIESLEMQGNLLVTTIPGPEVEVIVEEAVRELQNGCFYAMVRKLTLHQRMTFSLVDMFGLSINEVAELLQLSESATKGLLHRARVNLDAFFSDHCNIINEQYSCSCQAWIHFRESQEQNQQMAQRIIKSLEDNTEGYIFNQAVRDKIYFLYRNMPDKKPNKQWFRDTVMALK